MLTFIAREKLVQLVSSAGVRSSSLILAPWISFWPILVSVLLILGY